MSSYKPDKAELPILDANNYTLWKHKMRLYLTLKDLWHVIEAPTDATPKESAKALSIVGLCVADHHVPLVTTCTSAYEAWETLRRIFEPQIAGRAIKLQRDLAHLRMKADESVEVYMGRARQLYTDLMNAGVSTSEHQVVTGAIAGLPARFDGIIILYGVTLAQTERRRLHRSLARIVNSSIALCTICDVVANGPDIVGRRAFVIHAHSPRR